MARFLPTGEALLLSRHEPNDPAVVDLFDHLVLRVSGAVCARLMGVDPVEKGRRISGK